VGCGNRSGCQRDIPYRLWYQRLIYIFGIMFTLLLLFVPIASLCFCVGYSIKHKLYSHAIFCSVAVILLIPLAIKLYQLIEQSAVWN
jgi:hypothetical protein